MIRYYRLACQQPVVVMCSGSFGLALLCSSSTTTVVLTHRHPSFSRPDKRRPRKHALQVPRYRMQWWGKDLREQPIKMPLAGG